MNKKYESPTKAIRNLGNILILKFIALNKISGKMKVNRFKIPNYAQPNRQAQGKMKKCRNENYNEKEKILKKHKLTYK